MVCNLHLIKMIFSSKGNIFLEKNQNFIKKIPNTSDLAKKTDLNTKTAEIEDKISLATSSAFNAKPTETENKVPDTSHFINTQEFNKLTKRSFDIQKNIFAFLLSVHSTISLSCHEQVRFLRLRFERYFSHHRV